MEFQNSLTDTSDIPKCDGKISEKAEKRTNETSDRGRDLRLQGFYLLDYHKGLCLCYASFRFSIPLIYFYFFHNRII